MKKDIPIFDIVLNEKNLEQGVGYISLVDDPAIKVNWIKLAKQSSLSFKSDTDKQLLYGPFLIPNMLIYRHDEQNGEYYVRFSKEEIEKISSKFNEDLNNKNISFMHTNEMVDAFVASNWIIEDGQDKSRNLGFDLPEGTWFGSVKVKDSEFWINKVKNEEVKGFSVEILADLELSLKNKQNKMKNELKLASSVIADGSSIYYDGDLAVGTALFTDESLTVPVSGNVELEDGTRITIEEGIVTEIIEADVSVEQAEGDAPVDETVSSEPLTAEEVSAMIDARFTELMEEITALKVLVEGADVSSEEMKAKYELEFKTMKEKLSSTPATQPLKVVKTPTMNHFEAMEARIKEFARTK
jgi:hypothetical protein